MGDIITQNGLTTAWAVSCWMVTVSSKARVGLSDSRAGLELVAFLSSEPSEDFLSHSGSPGGYCDGAPVQRDTRKRQTKICSARLVSRPGKMFGSRPVAARVQVGETLI
jgi:hypothetical protein